MFFLNIMHLHFLIQIGKDHYRDKLLLPIRFKLTLSLNERQAILRIQVRCTHTGTTTHNRQPHKCQH